VCAEPREGVVAHRAALNSRHAQSTSACEENQALLVRVEGRDDLPDDGDLPADRDSVPGREWNITSETTGCDDCVSVTEFV
jgi:hypothetical protein